MGEEEFKKLLDKYLKGEASKQEQALLDEFYAKYEHKAKGDSQSFDPSIKSRAKANIQRRVRYPKNLPDDSRRKAITMLPRVAASIILVAGIGILTYLYLWPSINQQTVVTNDRQRRSVELPDGSRVTLNSESQLTYPKWFLGSKREVKLEGEAFFEVQRDENKPFTVKSGEVITTALGTSFNISAHPYQNISVSVATGKVRVEPTQSQILRAESHELLPGDQALFNTQTKSLTKSTTDLDIILAWKAKELNFNKTTLKKAIMMLERRFQVSINLENEKLGERMIYLAKYREEPLLEILSTLGMALKFEYEFEEENRITIKE